MEFMFLDVINNTRTIYSLACGTNNKLQRALISAAE